MEQNEIINKLASLEFDGKSVYSKNRTLALVKKFNYENLILYYEKYHKSEYQLGNPEFKLRRFENYRSKILDFIYYCQNENINIYNFTQNQLESYFNKEAKSGTLGVRKVAVEQFLRRCAVILDYSKIAERVKVLKEYQKNAHPLSSKEIEKIRCYYRDDKFKLFIFEWLYSLGLSKDDFDNFNIEDFDHDNNIIIVNKERRKIPVYLSDLINRIRTDERFHKTGSVINVNIRKMEKELYTDNIIEGPFRDMDIKETIKVRTYNVCPGCGNKYENIADNWVVMQYENSDTYWIVCKEKCGKLDE